MEKQAHFSMIRGFHLADWFTIGNAFCGMGAVLAVMAYLQGNLPQGLYISAGLVPLAFIFDAAFSIEHVHGHHTRVATAEDPAGTRLLSALSR